MPQQSDSQIQFPGAFAELHVHLEGTLEPSTIYDFAARNALQLPYAGIEDLASRYEFENLQSFLDLYYANMATLRTAADFEDMAWRYARRAHAGGVRHAEVFVDPQAHTIRGINIATVLSGVQAGLDRAYAELGLSSGIIVCVLRDQPPSDALSMLDQALSTEVPLLGIGLDSAELGYPPSLFKEVFALAAEAGLHRVAHAGEEGPPDYIWQALDLLGAERIDHGVRCLEDAALVRRLRADGIPLTVCPMSNVRLKVVSQASEHPLRRMLDKGLVVTVNSDDPAYFGGYLDDNLRAVTAALNLGQGELQTLSTNSIHASFASAARKAMLLSALASADRL